MILRWRGSDYQAQSEQKICTLCDCANVQATKRLLILCKREARTVGDKYMTPSILIATPRYTWGVLPGISRANTFFFQTLGWWDMGTLVMRKKKSDLHLFCSHMLIFPILDHNFSKDISSLSITLTRAYHMWEPASSVRCRCWNVLRSRCAFPACQDADASNNAFPSPMKVSSEGIAGVGFISTQGC